MRSRQKRIKRRYNVIDSIIKLAVAITIVTAAELTIRWNHINGVYSVAPTGQTIPLVLGIAAVTVVLYKAITSEEDDALARGATAFFVVPAMMSSALTSD